MLCEQSDVGVGVAVLVVGLPSLAGVSGVQWMLVWRERRRTRVLI